MTFYLKYRPQTIEELDLDFVRQQLKQILSSKNLPHAFLFSGPRGLGKTSAARILAKAINCESGKKSIEPCNECEVCKSITNGTAMDLIEIDAASNRGIDDIRALKSTINLSPSSLAFKVYVIDEVHMLTAEAFNALLKTLEEPPKHAIFILATTEPHKLPATIISRCLEIKFKKATRLELVRSLKRIIEQEKITIEPETLALIADQAEGSFRDATKILEQLAFEGKKITGQMVKNFFNQGGNFEVFEWLSTILAKDTEGSLQDLAQAVELGVDLKWLTMQVLEALRQLLLFQCGLSGQESVWQKKWGGKIAKEDLLQLIDHMAQAGADLKNALIPQLPLELAIIKWSASGRTSRDLENPAQGDLVKKNPINKENIISQKPVPATSELNQQNSKAIKTRFEDVVKNWEKILRALRPHNNSIEALLRGARPFNLNGSVLTLEVFYQFHKEKLEDKRCPKIINQVLKDAFGEEIKIKCVLGKKKPTLPEPEKMIKTKDSDLVKTAEEIFSRRR